METSVRKMLAAWDLRPQKRLGQSFLEDLNVVRRLVDLAEPGAQETVVEIGAGLGFMTEELAKRAGRVIAVEVDPRLAAVLRKRFAGENRVEIVQEDVMTYDFSSPASRKRVKVVGNIPYLISTPILFRLIEFRRSISSMVLMFQKELAERIAASPGTRLYGIPSVMVAKYMQTEYAMTVPPTCFYPVPQVVSSVLRMTFFDRPGFAGEARFLALVRAAFAQRRKTLWNNLRRLDLPEETVAGILMRCGIDRNRRAETLSVEEFCLLASFWAEAPE